MKTNTAKVTDIPRHFNGLNSLTAAALAAGLDRGGEISGRKEDA